MKVLDRYMDMLGPPEMCFLPVTLCVLLCLFPAVHGLLGGDPVNEGSGLRNKNASHTVGVSLLLLAIQIQPHKHWNRLFSCVNVCVCLCV